MRRDSEWEEGSFEGGTKMRWYLRDKSNRLQRYVDSRQVRRVAHLSASGVGSLLMRIISVGMGGVKTICENCCRCQKKGITMQTKSFLPFCCCTSANWLCPRRHCVQHVSHVLPVLYHRRYESSVKALMAVVEHAKEKYDTF